VAAVRSGGRALSGEESLTGEQEMMEAILLGLRTADGIDLSDFERRFGVDFMQAHGGAATELQAQGLIRLADGRCAPTLRGMLYVNTVAAALA
jgi:oxygen-independent coproporphyrinogen-3 oxidase